LTRWYPRSKRLRNLLWEQEESAIRIICLRHNWKPIMTHPKGDSKPRNIRQSFDRCPYRWPDGHLRDLQAYELGSRELNVETSPGMGPGKALDWRR